MLLVQVLGTIAFDTTTDVAKKVGFGFCSCEEVKWRPRVVASNYRARLSGRPTLRDRGLL